MTDLLLGIDLGTSSAKALLVDLEGQLAGRSSAEYPIYRSRVGYAEQDPEEWWISLVKAVRTAVDCCTVYKPHVRAIGLSGQMHGTVLLDKRDNLLSPAIIWPDQRGVKQAEEINETLGLENLVGIAGSPVSSGFQAASVRWFQQMEPELWAKTKKILTPKDWIHWRMTGEFNSEPSDGSGTILFDFKRRDWSDNILNILEIDRDLLPPMGVSKEIAGGLNADAAADLGLKLGVPIVAGGADTACSLLGAGVIDRGKVLVTISSGGQILRPLRQVKLDYSGKSHTFCSLFEPGDSRCAWYLMAATLSAGLSLRWLRDNIFQLGKPEAYEIMTGWAENSPPGSRGLLFLPYLQGERSPIMDQWARGIFLGLTSAHNRPDLVRAVMEGVVFACYDAYLQLILLDSAPSEIIVAGGGSRSSLWLQIIADVFGKRVKASIVEEQSAFGASILAGIGLGLFDIDTTMRNWIHYGPLIEANLERHEHYQELFLLFQKSYQDHKDDFAILSRLSGFAA